MNAFVLRTVTPADVEAVGVLLSASYPKLMAASYPPDPLAQALPMMTRANPSLLSSGTWYVAESTADGALVGCGGWTRERPGGGTVEPGLAHIRHFATHPDWIGKGVGRAIYQRSEDEARAAGIDRFECYSSLNGEPFYRALGFETIRRFEVPMGSDITLTSVLMRYTLPMRAV